MTKLFAVALATAYLFFASYTCSPAIMVNSKEGAVNMERIDLRQYDKASNKQNIDILLEQTPEYSVNCAMADFIPKKKYAGFNLTKIIPSAEREHIRAWYRLENNKNEDDYDARFNMTFYQSREKNHEHMRNFVEWEISAPSAYLSNLKIGDFALGDTYSIDFIRGNVSVRVMGSHKAKVEIGGLATEIDRQISDILTQNQD